MASNAIMNRGSVVYRIERLEEALIDRTSGRSLESSSIGAGGLSIIDEGALIVNGGVFESLSPLGIPILRTGPDRHGRRVWECNYDDETRAIGTNTLFNEQTLSIRDQRGNEVFGTASAAGNGKSTGLSRPYISYPFYSTFDAEYDGTRLWPSTTSSVFTPLLIATVPVFHARIRVTVATATAGGGNCEWRLTCNGIDITSTQTDSGVELANIPGWGDDEDGITPGNVVDLEIHARTANGATRAYAQPQSAYGFAG